MRGDEQIHFLHDNAGLSPSTVLVHGSTLSDGAYRCIADSGAHLSISAESELNAGQGHPPTAKAREHGIPLSLPMDTVPSWTERRASMPTTTQSPTTTSTTPVTDTTLTSTGWASTPAGRPSAGASRATTLPTPAR
ncbi:hypothetical protein [Streptomyces sp. NPDC096132]|uniref:hypothetical protein n=1 Tax=Streptomyces sp. NPDC096132 TaxID=3366075 RepID=UPI00380D9FDC